MSRSFAFILSANILGWPIIQLSVAAWMLHRPASSFAHDNALTRERQWEQHGRLYRRLFAVERWKHLLPDAAPWLGGVAKKQFLYPAPDFPRLLAETRRAELAHWIMLAFTPLFFLWNPLWACAVMTAYGLLTNIPCILAQRFNRARLRRALSRNI